MKSNHFVVGFLFDLSHGSVLLLVLSFSLLGIKCLNLSLGENAGGSWTEGETTELRDFLELRDGLSEHRVEPDRALLLINESSSWPLSVDNKASTESIPSSNSLLIANFMASGLSKIEDLDFVAFKLVVLLVFSHHLTLPLDVVGIGSSLFNFNFTLHNQEGAPYVLHVRAYAFCLTNGEDLSSRRPANVGHFLRGMVAEMVHFKASAFVLVAFVNVNSLSHGSKGVVLLASLNNSLGIGVNREASMDRFPLNAIEFLDFTLNLEDFVGYTIALGKIKDFNRALFLALQEVIVLDSKVISSRLHEHF